MHQGQLVFAQLMRHLPLTTFRRCVARYAGEHKVKSFSCLDQFLCMAFAQLTYRESLRDIEASLRGQSAKLHHLGIRGNIARNALTNANAVRDWHIYANFAGRLIGIARGLYAEEPRTKPTLRASYPCDRCISGFLSRKPPSITVQWVHRQLHPRRFRGAHVRASSLDRRARIGEATRWNTVGDTGARSTGVFD
jgi:Domain of unknown function (DUF4372)